MVKWIYLLVFLWPGSVLASLPVSWPSSLDDVDYTIGNGGTVAIVWQQSNGTWFCGAGSLTNAPSLILNLPGKGDETFSEYLERVKAKIFTRELTELEVNLCNVLLIRNREEWIVDQYREYPTRPVYQITDAFPSVKERIGNVNHGASVASIQVSVPVPAFSISK